MFVCLDSSVLWWILISSWVLVLSYLYITWPYNYFKHQGIPGPKPVPFLGNMNEMGKKPVWVQDAKWIKDYGSVFGFYIFGKKAMMISDREILREIFIKEFDCFSDKPQVPSRGILKYGLIDMKGQAWKDQRHQLSPYFSAGTMKMSTKSINQILDNLLIWLDEKCNKNEMIEAREFAQLMAMDVICSIAFGVEVNSCKTPDIELLAKAKELIRSHSIENKLFILSVIFPTFGKLLDLLKVELFDWQYFIKFSQHLIKERKEMDKKNGHDFLNILLNERRGSQKVLTDDEIIANAILFLLAGYDTTAGTLSFLLYNFAVYQECQEKAFQEIQDVIGAENPTYENVQKLTYMEMCLDETLRLCPVLPRLERLCVKDTVVKGLSFEKGMTLMMPIGHIHRDPEIWEDPENFIPERFTPENKRNRDPLTYAPFGVGPRHCIGMRLALLELKMAAVRILQMFTIVRNKKTQVPIEFDSKSFMVMAKNGIWISLKRREMKHVDFM